MAWAWASTCTERMVICLRQCSQTASGSRVSQLRCQFYVDVLFLKYQHPDVDCRSPWFPWFMVSLTKRTRCRVYVARWAVDLRAKARHSIHPRADSHDLFVYAPVAPTPECLRLLRESEEEHGEVLHIVLPTVAVEHKHYGSNYFLRGFFACNRKCSKLSLVSERWDKGKIYMKYIYEINGKHQGFL